MKKKLLILTAAVIFCCALFAVSVSAATWDGTAATGFAGGSGTQADPYRIATAEQLAYLAQSVNGGTAYEGKYFKLTADIVLNDTAAENWTATAKKWTPIGKSRNYPFSGSFDGGNHTVSGLYIKTNASSNYQGLFGYTKNASFKNLTIEKSSVTAGTYVGALVSFAEGTITVESCTNSGSISGSRYAGGIIGELNTEAASIKNCTNKGTVSASSTIVGAAGGIIGGGSGTVENCTNEGTVIAPGETNAGGIVGQYSGTVSNCINRGTVTASKYAGGIAGCSLRGAKYENCTNVGAVSSSSSDSAIVVCAGGIVGECSAVMEAEEFIFVNCSNSGKVSAVNYTPQSSWIYAYAGGIMGQCDSSTKYTAAVSFTDCVNSGDVTSSATAGGMYYLEAYAGGIAGSCPSDSAFTGCVNDAAVSVVSDFYAFAGGILGNCDSETTDAVLSLEDCVNRGAVVADAFNVPNYVTACAGGVVGYSGTAASLTACMNDGNVTASAGNGNSVYAYAGGLAGALEADAAISLCINNGDVKASSSDEAYAGGIAGICDAVITIRNCYNAGVSSGSGIVDFASSGTISCCYNVGSAGGKAIAEAPGETALTNCYYLTGSAWPDLSAAACTDAQMRQQNTFAGFDFSGIWTMEGSPSYPYPELRGINHPADPDVKVICIGPVAYTVSGRVVTVKHTAACKVGYLNDGIYVALPVTWNGGTYSFTAPKGIKEVLLVVKGDVNGDGKITSSDYGRLNASLLGKVILTPETAFAADVNGDGKANSSDYGRLNAVMLGKTSLAW